MYAHIFKTREGWTVIYTETAAVNSGVIRTEHWPNKTAAKKSAAAAGATPWNY
jgi:hypothetical protein